MTTTADEIYKEVNKQADDIFGYIKKSTKNIAWTMEIQFIRWDCQIRIDGTYLNYHSVVYSPSLDLDKAISDGDYISSRLKYFGDYVLHTTIQNIARALFENK